MRLTLLLALTVLAGVTIGQAALLSCSNDDDCPRENLCCHTKDTGLFDDRVAGVCAAQCKMQESPRQKRSIGGVVARALGTLIKRLARWYRRRGVGSTTSTGLKIITRRGGLRQAQRDFYRFASRSEIKSVRSIPGGRVAIAKDGSRMIVRQMSKDGRPTLELQNASGRAIIKYRYEP